MKKYKLKKDLPTWKAGEEFWIGEDENLYGMSEDGRAIMVYHFSTLFNFDLLKNGEWFEEVQEKLKNIWDLKEGDTYYYLDLNCSYSKVSPFTIFTEDDFLSYKSNLENGNIFLTEEEAEKELKKRKIIVKIKKYCWENGIETDYKKIENGKFCYLLVYDFLNDRLSVARISEVNIFYSPIGYFSEENAEKILEKFENDLKFLFDNF